VYDQGRAQRPRQENHIADRQEIAATLAAAMLSPILYGGGGSPEDRAAVINRHAHEAVTVYHAVIAELAKQENPGRSGS
jgi:hypothetical protein